MHSQVEGQAFALRPLGDTLLVATSMYLEIFEAHALNEKEKKSISMARWDLFKTKALGLRLPVNAMVPRRDLEVENSLGVLEDEDFKSLPFQPGCGLADWARPLQAQYVRGDLQSWLLLSVT